MKEELQPEIQSEIKLSEKLEAVDTNMRYLWDALSDENKKSLKGDFFILNRFISNVEGQSRKIQEHFVCTVNDYYNKDWFLLQHHPKLVWLLLCMCSYDNNTIYFHKWIGFKKKEGSDNKKVKFLAEINPTMKMDEVEMLAKLTPAKELTRLAKDYGFEDTYIKKKLK